mgnify:CR=1 FL=1
MVTPGMSNVQCVTWCGLRGQAGRLQITNFSFTWDPRPWSDYSHSMSPHIRCWWSLVVTTEVFTWCPVWAPGASLDINHPIKPPVSHIRLRSTLNNQLVIYSRPLSASQKASLCRNFVITSLLPSPGAWGRGQVSQVHYESSWPRGDT